MPTFDRLELTPLVRQLLDHPTAKVIDYHCQPITIGRGSATSGVYRFTGSAQTTDGKQSWSLILKILSPTAHGNVPAELLDITHPLYWKREALAYQSALLDALPQGLRSPRCFAAVEQPDDTLWLWLEEATEAASSRWPMTQFEHAAQALARFNAYYLAQPIPPYAWLTRDGSPRGVLNHFAWLQDVIKNPALWQHSLVRMAYPLPVADRLLQLWSDRDVLLDAFEKLPRTLCHLDAWRKNMFAASDGTITLIDWAYVGRGILATDPADLFGASYGLFGAEPCTPAALDAAIFNSYLDGLQAAGWHGDQRIVRFAYTTFASLKYAGLLLELHDVLDEAKYASWEDISGHSMSDFFHLKAELTYYLLDLADEARRLMP